MDQQRLVWGLPKRRGWQLAGHWGDPRVLEEAPWNGAWQLVGWLEREGPTIFPSAVLMAPLSVKPWTLGPMISNIHVLLLVLLSTQKIQQSWCLMGDIKRHATCGRNKVFVACLAADATSPRQFLIFCCEAVVPVPLSRVWAQETAISPQVWCVHVVYVLLHV